ncbi:hypothetical protein JXM67_02685 [candidate division WOR-3 bacterium]|nr:hypothetical protein [candidate division WOR-3 bacterium]
MSEKSKQIVKKSIGDYFGEWQDKSRPLPLEPSTLSEMFAIQLTIFPRTQEYIARFSAQALLACFYMSNLDNYRRIFETDYPSGEIEDLENLQLREEETDRWLAERFPKDLENLGARVSNLEEYEILHRFLENTRQKIIRRQQDFKEFSAQLSFFDEPKKFLRRVNDALGHTHILSGKGEAQTPLGTFKGVLHGYFEYKELEKGPYAIAEQ